jgi:hypothetical protein
MSRPATKPIRSLLWLAALCLSFGCQTTRPLPALDLQEPGWQVRRGMAVWRPRAQAPELAGDFVFARHADGRTLAQFLKIPLPTVTARSEAHRWQIEFQPQNRRYGGPGQAPARLLFCHVAKAVAGGALPADLAAASSTTNTQTTLRLWHRQTGELLAITWAP